MSTCYLLGAGASYGHDDSNTPEQRPPLTDEFLSKGAKLGVLSEPEFSELRTHVERYVGLDGPLSEADPSTLGFDFERFLARTSRRLQETRDETYRTVLSQAFFYIYEVLRHYCSKYSPVVAMDNYYELANRFARQRYSAIVLNYDVLFEKALESRGYAPDYGITRPRDGTTVPVAKLHGSINWFNTIGEPYVDGPVEPEDVARTIYGNRFRTSEAPGQQGGLVTSSAGDLPSFRTLLNSEGNVYEPAIVPPVAEHKDYEKIRAYESVWSYAETLLANSTELVVIGASLRAEDTRIRQLLAENVPGGVTVHLAVGSSTGTVREILCDLLTEPEFESYRYFSDYVERMA